MKCETKKGNEHLVAASAKKTGRMFARTLPYILAVVFLSGLFIEFVPVKDLTAVLGGGLLTDGLMGAAIGSVYMLLFSLLNGFFTERLAAGERVEEEDYGSG